MSDFTISGKVATFFARGGKSENNPQAEFLNFTPKSHGFYVGVTCYATIKLIIKIHDWYIFIDSNKICFSGTSKESFTVV